MIHSRPSEWQRCVFVCCVAPSLNLRTRFWTRRNFMKVHLFHFTSRKCRAVMTICIIFPRSLFRSNYHRGGIWTSLAVTCYSISFMRPSGCLPFIFQIELNAGCFHFISPRYKFEIGISQREIGRRQFFLKILPCETHSTQWSDCISNE